MGAAQALPVAGVATGALLGVAISVSASAGLPLALTYAALIGCLLGLATALVPSPERRAVVCLVVLTFAMRAALGVLLMAWSEANGRGGFITGDDSGYGQLALGFAAYLRGQAEPPMVPPSWAGEAYLFSAWVYLESFAFLALGPHLAVGLALNAFFGAATALLLFDAARRLFGHAPALVTVTVSAFWPSLVLWSSLNLKDTLTGLLIVVVIWAVLRCQLEAGARYLAVAALALVPLEGLRDYVYLLLVFVVPVAVWLTPRWDWPRRLRIGSAATAAGTVLLLTSSASAAIGPGLFLTLESVRAGMAVGARTAFVAPPPTPAPIPFTPPIAAATAAPVIQQAVPVATAIAAAASEPIDTAVPPPEPTPGAVLVPSQIEAPTPAATVAAETSRTVRVSDSTPPPELSAAARTLAHLPTGLAHVMFAPFPWSARRALDLPAIAETLVWSILLAAALALVLGRGRERRLMSAPLLFTVGLALFFALTEGNVGTLFRHRGMLIPPVILLASPVLAGAVASFARRASATDRRAVRTAAI